MAAMSSTKSLFSQTLQDITNTKLEELAKKRDAFETRKKNAITAAGQAPDGVERIRSLHDGVKSCFGVPLKDGRVVRGSTHSARLEVDLINIERFLEQAKYDPCISPKVLAQWQTTLLEHLNIQSVKYSYASLYGQLTTEWLSVKQKPKSGDDVEMEDFEQVSSGKKLEARANWESTVFEPAPVDEAALSQMLKNTFEATPNESKQHLKAMKQLREKIQEHERDLASQSAIDRNSLQWTIDGLIGSDLLTEDKLSVLLDFRHNNVVLDEIVDVLNMRLQAIESWSWGDFVPLEQRRQINGTFKIFMHEDIIQAIFLQFIGVKWAVLFKNAFLRYYKYKGVWKTGREAISGAEQKRRDEYLGLMDHEPCLTLTKQKVYRKNYLLARLQDVEDQHPISEQGEEEADIDNDNHAKQKRAQQTAQKGQTQQQRAQYTQANRMVQAPAAATQSGGLFSQAPAPGRGLAARVGSKRHRRMPPPKDEELDSELEDDEVFEEDSDMFEKKSPMDARQTLLHLLSSNALIKTRTDGQITCFRSQFDDLYPSLPHATIKVVLGFFGVSEKWLDFFTRFLEAPLQFTDDTAAAPRKRKQGTPGAHALSEVFSEVVLFCVDFIVNQKTNGELLWRYANDFWFWSSNKANCETAWTAITDFANVAGLTLNEGRTGGAHMLRNPKNPDKLISQSPGGSLPSEPIRWGMLVFNPSTGRFEIDQAAVDRHVTDLSRQLQDQSSSVFAWIQAWNSYVATFFSSNFGKPANCFGQQHVDDMLAMHKRIQQLLFSERSTEGVASTQSVVEFLKQIIAERYHITDIPDGYFFFPTELGGLDLRSPFIPLLLLRDSVPSRPQKLLDDYFDKERESYNSHKKEWERGREKRHNNAGGLFGAQSRVPQTGRSENDEFIPWEEYIKFREEAPSGFQGDLTDVFTELMKHPDQQYPEHDDSGELQSALDGITKHRNLSAIVSNWHSMNAYWKWVSTLYGPEVARKFGGFDIVEPGLLPMGMVNLFRSGRVSWAE